MTNTCIACAIASGQSPAYIIHQNERIICFLDHAPINPGHILICPRAHLADLTDLPEDLLAEISKAARDMAQLLMDKMGCDGVSLLQNDGAFNDLGHFHLHVFSRHVGDGFGWVSVRHGDDGPAALARVQKNLVGGSDGHGPSLPKLQLTSSAISTDFSGCSHLDMQIVQDEETLDEHLHEQSALRKNSQHFEHTFQAQATREAIEPS